MIATPPYLWVGTGSSLALKTSPQSILSAIVPGMKIAMSNSMNEAGLLAFVVATSMLLVGCNRLGEQDNPSAQASREFNYDFDKKEVFVADVSNDLAALNQRINELADKTATASDVVKTNAQVEIQALRNQHTALSKKLLGLKQATEANWNDEKSDFVKSYNQAKISCQQAYQRLTKKLGS